MADTTLGFQFKALQIQLAVLKAQLDSLELHPGASTLGDLYGMLAENGTFTEEEIEAAQYRCDWDGAEDEGSAA